MTEIPSATHKDGSSGARIDHGAEGAPDHHRPRNRSLDEDGSRDILRPRSSPCCSHWNPALRALPRSRGRMKLARDSLRARLLWLTREWEMYADRAKERRERRAYRDAAEALRREMRRSARRAWG